MITVLLATRNGAAFLQEQMDSILGQSHSNWRVMVGDDGSTDGTLGLLETYLTKLGPDRIQICDGPGRGATANFIGLLMKTTSDDGLIAFCDQDDLWMPDKLDRACRAVTDISGPAIYASAVMITDMNATGGHLSRRPGRGLGFSHALAENVLTGNTMVLNPEAAKLIRDAVTSCEDRSALEGGFHDWFAYQVVASAGGAVIYDPAPGVFYRQHSANAVGSGQAKGRFLHRLRRVFGGEYGRALRRQAEALKGCRLLADNPRKQVELLLAIRDMPVWQRPAAIRRVGLYRQARSEHILLVMLLVLGRI